MAQEPLHLREVLNTPRLTLTLFNPESQQHYNSLFPIIVYLKGSFLGQSLSPDDRDRIARQEATESMAFYSNHGRISNSLLGGRRPTTAALWVIRLGANSPDGECIGVASVLHRAYIPDQGWAVVPQYQGVGYATEASAEVLRYCREELKLEEMLVTTKATNPKSRGVALKLGYVIREGGLYMEDGTVLDLLTLPGASLPPKGSNFTSHYTLLPTKE